MTDHNRDWRLRRSCEICQRDAKIAELREAIALANAERDAAEFEAARIHDLAGKEIAELRAEVERLRCAISHIGAMVRDPLIAPIDVVRVSKDIIARLPNATDQGWGA